MPSPPPETASWPSGETASEFMPRPCPICATGPAAVPRWVAISPPMRQAWTGSGCCCVSAETAPPHTAKTASAANHCHTVAFKAIAFPRKHSRKQRGTISLRSRRMLDEFIAQDGFQSGTEVNRPAALQVAALVAAEGSCGDNPAAACGSRTLGCNFQHLACRNERAAEVSGHSGGCSATGQANNCFLYSN